MAATHCFIQLFSGDEPDEQEIELFTSEQCTKEEEEQLLSRIRELFTYIVPLAKTIKLNLQVQVTDTATTKFTLSKKFSCKHQYVNAHKLSKRELQIIDLISQGFINKEIAEKLCISTETVKSHRKHVLLKTGSKNTAMLITHYDQFLANN